MIALLRRLLRVGPTPDTAWSDVAIAAFLTTPPAPMQEIRPPQASNDDPLNVLREGLERELRAVALIR
ncbi:hypothetical protein [Methylobacterium sp. J-070]|uniref:hypothetical protein n=1 Tax=Methylobacterium sp. J-070 TaxID=2836650 RepID=UPI001FBA40EC|nr:hypothetical protein [Methylobacterium sp. J-070]MCJ2052507.1 hypothetical protein [Methylobacterium sp. J-070]